MGIWGGPKDCVSCTCMIPSACAHSSPVTGGGGAVLQLVFQQGDRVRGLIIGMERGFQRISFSTAELEENDGDMVEDPVRHFKTLNTSSY